MDKKLRVVSFDGTRGSGKTSQINMLAKYLRSVGDRVIVLKMKESSSILANLEVLKDAVEVLDNGGVVIFDGSIARPMVNDLIGGVSNTALLEKFKILIQAYSRIDRQYDIANFLMVMDNIEECNRRIEKFKETTGVVVEKIENLKTEKDIVSGMRLFNNHISSRDIHFQVLNIQASDTMLDVHEAILKKLSEKYKIPKPKKDLNDW